MSRFIKTISAVALAAMLSIQALAATWIVDANNGPGTNFVTISAAISAAAPGDIILVRPGIYGEIVIVSKPLTIIGWNATQYPIVVPQDPFSPAIWGGLAVSGIPAGQKCIISGLSVCRPTLTAGNSVGVLNCAGTVVLDRVIVPNGGVLITNSTDVILESLYVRHLQGAFPPQIGVYIENSWVQANDLNATGGDCVSEPDFFPTAANALEVIGNSIVALCRPKLIGGFGGGPWITSASSPQGGIALRCVGSQVAIVDDVGSGSYIVGGQGGFRGAASAFTIPSGSGGHAIEIVAGIVTNKKPLNPIPGAPGLHIGGGPIGSFGSIAATGPGGSYSPITDLPAVSREYSVSQPGGFWVFDHHSWGAGIPVAVAFMPDMGLSLFPPSLQFQGGDISTAILLGVGTSNGIGRLSFGFLLPTQLMTPHVGMSLTIQSADDVANTLFLSNPMSFVLSY
jgi:hypothetical protein